MFQGVGGDGPHGRVLQKPIPTCMLPGTWMSGRVSKKGVGGERKYQ